MKQAGLNSHLSQGSVVVEAKGMSVLLAFLAIAARPSMTTAQELTIAEFDVIVKACADSKGITITGNLTTEIHNMYSDQTKRKSLNSLGQFLLNTPDSDRSDAYKLYNECIAQLFPSPIAAAPGSPQPAAPAIVTYKVCQGEYQQACPQHDVYLYCNSDLKAWAASHCTSYTTSHLSSRGGNKCGYELYTVVCTGPR